MTLKQTLCVLVLGWLVVAPPRVTAQKKPGSSPDLPGTLEFSCESGSFTNVFCANGDRIVGDDRRYPGIGTPEGGQGAFLHGSSKELWLGFGDGLYKLLIDFNERADVPPCAATRSCRMNESRFPGNLMLVDVEDAEIQSNVVTGPGGTEVPGGLVALDVGETGHARLKINFADPLDGSLWTIRFNPLEYAGSNEVPVTRIGPCAWRFDSDGDDDDGNGVIEPLAGVPGTYNKRTKVRSDEGLFILRFSMTLEIPAPCQ